MATLNEVKAFQKRERAKHAAAALPSARQLLQRLVEAQALPFDHAERRAALTAARAYLAPAHPGQHPLPLP